MVEAHSPRASQIGQEEVWDRASLLDEIRASDDARVMRTATNTFRKTSPPKQGIRSARQPKSYPLCKQAGRPNSSHFLSESRHLPEDDRKYIAKARQIANIFDEPLEDSSELTPYADDNGFNDENNSLACGPEPTALRIQTRQSPYIDSFYAHHSVRITLDSGATGNMIRHSIVTRLGCQVTPSSQSAHQADGSSPLKVVGETRLSFTRDNREFSFEVVEKW